MVRAGTAKCSLKCDLRWTGRNWSEMSSQCRNWSEMSLGLSVQPTQHGTAALTPLLAGSCRGSRARLPSQLSEHQTFQGDSSEFIDFAALIQRINRGLNSPELSIWHLSSTFRLAWAFVFCFLFFFPFPITC